MCVSNIQTASERNKLVPPQVEALVAFITELHAFLSSCAAHSSIERSFEDISNLATDLHNELYATLPVFSRKLRDTVYGIERELVEENLHHSIMPQGSTLGSVFSDRWNSLVPKLSKLGKEYQKALNEAAAAARKSSAGSGSGDEADNEVTGGIDEDYSSGSSENELQVKRSAVSVCSDVMWRSTTVPSLSINPSIYQSIDACILLVFFPSMYSSYCTAHIV